MSNLREDQELRELTQMDNGVKRYYKEFEARGAGDSTAGLGLVYVGMRALIPWIEEQVSMLEDGKDHPSCVPLGIHWLCELQPDAVAYIASKLCVSAANSEAKMTRTALKIANLIEENYRYEELEREEPALANSMSKKAKRWSRASTRRKIMRKAADVAGVRRMGWTEQEKLKLGVKLIEAVERTTGLIEAKVIADPDKGGSHRQKIVTLTAEARKRLDERHEQIKCDDPENRVMVHPPKDWTSPVSGGYLTERMKSPILRGTARRSITEGLVDELFNSDISKVYDAVNTVQATAWRINAPLYKVMAEAHDNDIDLGVLPPQDRHGPDGELIEPIPLPPAPKGLPSREVAYEDMTTDEQALLKAWKTEAREVHSQNATYRSQSAALKSKLAQAADVVNYGAIYFPHSLDFRGRIYPMTAELSPQADDTSKALLEFAEGKPLGEAGGYWLCVHLANTYGEDKLAFDERIQWVKDNEDHIMRSATAPLDYPWWTDAEEPWCFLAACFEYAGWQVVGDEYESHLPIAMDGSCSGIQHFSAMLRDQRGAEAVNLTPKPVPSDIYTEVLEVVKAKLMKRKEPLAKVWLDKVDRKIVKRPCMTFAYSVTSAGIKQQILDEIRKRQHGTYLSGTPDWEAAVFLAPIVEESIREVVDRAAEAMDWLKGVSKIHSKAEIVQRDGSTVVGQATGWTTPLGFRVLQPYLKVRGKRIKVLYNGEQIDVTLSIEGTSIDSLKQASAVAPNFVHSMDATHLMMTVNRLVEEGVTDSFAVIHDSFAVHACDVDELHYALRDEFIKLYSEQEVLIGFYRESLLRLKGDTWPDVPVPPEAGEFNIEEVRDADFFFA